jgi:hypothetical protein
MLETKHHASGRDYDIFSFKVTSLKDYQVLIKIFLIKKGNVERVPRDELHKYFSVKLRFPNMG